MRSSSTRLILASVIGVLLAGALFAQPGSRVSNWTVPPYRAHSGSEGLTPMSDISEGAVFIAVTPCRIIDTRFASGTGHGTPALVAAAVRTFDMNAGPCTGIPENVAALSLSIAAINPPSNGFLTAWPTGTAQPLFSQLNYLSGQVIANAAIVAVNSLDQLNFFVNTGPTDIYVDVNGYFMDDDGTLNTGINLDWSGNTTNSFMFVWNQNTTASSLGLTAAIRGYMASTMPNVAGVIGESDSASGTNYGVLGLSVHVPGVGVRGDGGFRGVDGNGTGSASCGVCGTSFGGGNASGVSAFPGPSQTFATLYTTGNFLALGSKSFVEPHATDASKQINYISLEGPEAGTYFRGTGKFERGVARIPVPEHFRLITDEEGISVQITPIGAMATVAVMRADLNEILVQSSRNVEFYFTVNGIRKAFKNHNPVEENVIFRPESAGGRDIRPDLTPAAREALIRNGALNPDGTWNRETVRRLGWKLPEAAE